MSSALSVLQKLMITSALPLPRDLIENVHAFAFKKIGKIDKNDHRYTMLLNMPDKDFDPSDGVSFVYLRINDEKDYYLTYTSTEVQLQVFEYVDNVVNWVDGSVLTLA